MDNTLFDYCEIQSQTRDKRIMTDLSDALEISRRELHLDSCGDWCIMGRNGWINPGARAWFLMISAKSKRAWSATKKKLSFMELLKDGDEEGHFCLARLPTLEEAAILRKVVGLRKRPELATEHAQQLSIRMKTINRLRQNRSAEQADLSCLPN